MSTEKQVELGWWNRYHKFGSDMALAKQAVESTGIDQEYAKNGYVTTTLYPNNLFFILFKKNRPANKYFNSINASVFSIVDGEFTTLHSREVS